MTTPRFFRAWSWVAVLWIVAMTMGPRAWLAVTSVAQGRLERIVRATCEQHAGTVLPDTQRPPHCFRCDNPHGVERWP